MVEESVKFSRDFNVKKRKKIFRKIFMFFDVKAAPFICLEEIFQFRAQILKEHTRKYWGTGFSFKNSHSLIIIMRLENEQKNRSS